MKYKILLMLSALILISINCKANMIDAKRFDLNKNYTLSEFKNKFLDKGFEKGYKMDKDSLENFQEYSSGINIWIRYTPITHHILEYECDFDAANIQKSDVNIFVKSLINYYNLPSEIKCFYYDNDSIVKNISISSIDKLINENREFLLQWNINNRLLSFEYRFTDIHYRYENSKLNSLNIQEIAVLNKNILYNKIKEYIIIGFIILAILIVSAFLFRVVYKKNQEVKKREEETELRVKKRMEEIVKEKRAKEYAEKKQKEQEFNNYHQKLENECGKISKIIKLNNKEIEPYDEILIFNDSNKIVIDKQVYSFNDILNVRGNDYSYETDNEEFIESDSYSETKVKTGSMVGRAVVGGLLLGPVGAVIGGATAKRKHIDHGQPGHIIHHKEKHLSYSVSIVVRDINNSTLIINCQQDESLMHRIVDLITVIISER